MPTSPSPEERFWAKVDKTGGPERLSWNGSACWVWTAGKNKGYGSFWNGERTMGAHRWAYEEVNGPVADGFEIDHLCRVHGCVRPQHLEAVRHIDNVRRGETGKVCAARNRAKTHCPHGHLYAGENLRIRPNGSRQCVECNRMWCRASHAAHREARNTHKREHAAKNRESIRDKQRAYRASHRGKCLASGRAYYEANRADIAARKREYYIAHREQILASLQARRDRARKKALA